MIPVALLMIGLVFIVVGVQGKAEEAGAILVDDFTRAPSFLPWLAAVVIVAVLTSYSPLKKVGTAFYALLLIVLFLSNGGFFEKFRHQIME